MLFVALTVPPSDAVQIEGRAGWDGVAIAGFAVLMIVYFVALYSIAVGWHRALLLGEQPGWINFNAGRREAGYLGYMLLIALLSSLPMMTGFLIAGALSLSSGVSRGMLVFMGGCSLCCRASPRATAGSRSGNHLTSRAAIAGVSSAVYS